MTETPGPNPAPPNPGQPPITPPSPGQPPMPASPPGQPPTASPYEPVWAPPSVPSRGQPPILPPIGATPPPPPPANWAPYAQPKRNWKPWIVGALATFGLLIAGIGTCTYFFVTTVTAPIGPANAFLAEVDRNDYPGAMALTEPTCTGSFDTDDLERIFDGADIDYNLTNSSVQSGFARVSGALAVNGVRQPGVEVRLQEVEDEWRVCDLRIVEVARGLSG